MKETIYTIPINEAFEAHSGCPLCTLRRKLEADSLDYIMGAAMMEPDVRIQTNKRGFCDKHYSRMLTMNRKLSLALTLESRLAEIQRVLDKDTVKGFSHSLDPVRAAEYINETAGGCFVCERIKGYEEHYYKNILYMWDKTSEFRTLFMSQEYFCLRHTAGLLSRAPAELGKRNFADFNLMLIEIMYKYLQKIKASVSLYCQSFDYRSAGKILSEDELTAVEKAIEFLSGYKELENK